MAKLRMTRRPADLSSDRAATSAVEFAILAPVFLLLMMGMIAYGIYFGASHAIAQIAADAARSAIPGLDETERRSLARSFIASNAGQYAFIDPQRLTVDVAANPTDPNQFVVALRYDASDLPIWNLMPGLAVPASTIARSSTIRVGGL